MVVMSAPGDPVPSIARAFASYQQSAASRLRYAITEINLQTCHNLGYSLKVLDAAGGNGLTTEFLLNLGHHVTLYDSDPEMLAQAQARLTTRDLLARCRLVQGTFEGIADTLSGALYDLILCHHVLEYIDDGLRLLQTLHALCAPKGELSLITLNPVSEVMRAIVFGQDPDAAALKLSDLHYDAKWFGQARLYPLEDIVARAKQAGWQLKDFRGIRVLSDYVSKSEERLCEEKLLRLETLLANREPYRRMGRYLQFSFAKQEHPIEFRARS